MIILKDDVNSYDWIEYCYLSAIDGFGAKSGKIRSGHTSTITLTDINGAYVATMKMQMSVNTVTIISNNRLNLVSREIEDIQSIIIVEINGLRNT